MKRVIKIITVIVLFILLISWLIVSAIYKNEFWCLTFKEWISIILTIIIGIVIAYILNEKNTNKKLFLNTYIAKLNALRVLLESCRDTIFNNYLKKNFSTVILSNNKIISNSIELLSTYSDKMNITSEISFIKLQYAEFKTITTEYTSSLKDEDSRNKATLKINLMINKLDEIELKLFDVL